VGSKILLYSRAVEIDKIAECLGGKEEKHKSLFQAYLERQDYRENDIEKSLRSFLQTFRMAGIDSQVVFRILELFGAKFYSKDPSGIFADETECYEFAYLLIVL
jgi:Sec7-like guanine-nucleotide exchange factor